MLALRLLAVDPLLGGIVVRARNGPVRDAICARLPAGQTVHPAIDDDALFGGVDLAGMLAGSGPLHRAGLAARPGPVRLAMAERVPASLAGRLAAILDSGAGHVIYALDEGADAEERTPDTLASRLAFADDLDGIPISAIPAIPKADGAAGPLHAVTMSDDWYGVIARIADGLGITDVRPILFAVRAARALACIDARTTVSQDDVETACGLVLAHRATRLPQPADEAEETPAQETPDDTQAAGEDDAALTLPEDLLLAAVAAHIPPELLARLAARKARTGRGSGTGASRRGNRRGRPLPAQPGTPSSGRRIDVVATLRAAAPWQRLREGDGGSVGLRIRKSDLRVKQFEERSDRLLVFAVDASGSAALARLAEAKGAVELLLAQAYARRDHVALVAFRGTGAEVLLPATRSLVQTKRRLAALPGGGGTPLASGLVVSLEQALAGRHKGMTPTICLLTDGRANIARDGTPDRLRAASDAAETARAIRRMAIDAIVIDTGTRQEPQLREIAREMDAIYVALPRADAARLSRTISAAVGS